MMTSITIAYIFSVYPTDRLEHFFVLQEVRVGYQRIWLGPVVFSKLLVPELSYKPTEISCLIRIGSTGWLPMYCVWKLFRSRFQTVQFLSAVELCNPVERLWVNVLLGQEAINDRSFGNCNDKPVECIFYRRCSYLILWLAKALLSWCVKLKSKS